MLREALANLFSKARLNDASKARYTQHPGSKKNQNKRRHKLKLRAAQKRAKQSRKRNRRK